MRSLIAAVLVLAVMGGAWWLARSHDPEAPPATVGDQQTVEGEARETSLEPFEPAVAPEADEPAFRDRLRTFLAGASELSQARRHAGAEALRRDTLAREIDGSLLPAESAYIQLALLRATITNDAVLRRQSAELLARYEAASEQGWEEYRRRADPRHEGYREAEAELTRRAREEEISNEELRERLQALREQYYE